MFVTMTMKIERPTTRSSQQIAGPQMEHLAGAPFESAAHEQHLAAGVDARQ